MVVNDSGVLVQQQRETTSSKECVVLDLPSESREKTSSRKPRKIAMRRRAQHMYSLPSQTMETKLALRMVAYQSRHTTWLLSAQPDPRPLGTTGAIGIRIIAFSMLSHAKPYMRANGSPIAKLERKLSSTHHHQAGNTTLRALWHDCMRDYCFPPTAQC